MNAFGKSRIQIGIWGFIAVAAALAALYPAATGAAETVKVTTANWHIHKPSKEYKDLPALLPMETTLSPNDAPGIGQLEFVCLKSNYYMLLVQPSVKLRDAESGMISVRAANAPNGSKPTPLTFRNLYKTKTTLSRSMDWDADIHYAEIGAAQLASIKAAGELELALADRIFAISLSNLGSRIESFQQFCETGVVENPAHFEQP